ncbi:MAG: hypothetical protein G3M70_02330 [Candidatus Nitronauta litoralis]|uniref:Cytochrome c-552/4 domain-containing protein n=1 Tax=Candidatus Nitronauta litoralis TaxID=2705533 RepID=A0A7T0BTZ6_9BACT|nr:MAG: hypothetical protein G3M70_02330 [Candidatus Nitronauta litoralis]
MFKLRTFILSLCLILGGVWLAWAQETDNWEYWQNLYHQAQSELTQNESEKKAWLSKEPEIKRTKVTARLGDNKELVVSDLRGNKEEMCLTCHDGIEPMSTSHPASFGCTVCHGGDATSLNKTEAHASMIYDSTTGTGKRNPSALSVVHLSCGQIGCHAGHTDSSKNHIHRVRRSMMGTLSGMIAGLRYQWAAQSTPQAQYGVSRVPAPNNTEDELAGKLKPELEPLPFFLAKNRRQQIEQGQATGSEKVSHHPADGVLRSTCFQCHLDGKPVSGEYRSQGCAACHVSYSREGTYEGMDPTIPKDQTGHPSRHRMTALPEKTTCTKCHKSMGMDKTRIPGTLIKSIPSFAKGHPVEDVHTQAGMECIDCHSSFDVMGDGNLYSRQYEAVEIGCETCHGTVDRHPQIEKIDSNDLRVLRENRHYLNNPIKPGDWAVVSRRGRKLSNIKMHDGNITVFSKRGEKSWKIPLIKDGSVHRISRHNEKLACNACHSSWVPQCKGCHLVFNPKEKPSPWTGYKAEINYKEPTLLIGPDSKVRPAHAMPLNTLTALDPKGNSLPVINDEGDFQGRYRKFGFTNPRGYSGANTINATHPHSVGPKVRSCSSCHLSTEALGLGSSDLKIGRKSSGKRDAAKPVMQGNIYGTLGERSPLPKGTIQGQPVAGSHQPGTRSFNQKELNRILKVGNCLPCHDRESDPIYKNIEKSYKLATFKKHRARIKKAEGQR